MPKDSTSCAMPLPRPCPRRSATGSICRTLPRPGGGEASSPPGCSISRRWRLRRTRSFRAIRASSRIRAKAAGRSWRRSRRRCRSRCSPRRFMRASARARSTVSPTGCCRRCATSSAATSNRRAAGPMSEPAGVAREELDDEGFRRSLATGARELAETASAQDAWPWLSRRLYYVHGDFTAPDTYERISRRLREVSAAHRTGGNVLFYLATPPNLFAAIAGRLGAAGLLREESGCWRRLIVEKPFGTDLASAQALNRDLLAVMGEDQIFRIDHYLGKETVQNIMVLRFANGLFEPLWNRDHVDHVQITVAETVEVGRRGRFYDATGALRDMVPNHLFQLLSLAAMEPPSCFNAAAVRAEKAKVLDAVHRLTPSDVRRNVVRGQYGAGLVEGRAVRAYRDTPDVAPSSRTETYVAMKLMIDNWRWAGVPFYLRTGKALARRRTEVVIQFKQAPLTLFRDTPVERLTANDLVLHIQPDEGASLRFNA